MTPKKRAGRKAKGPELRTEFLTLRLTALEKASLQRQAESAKQRPLTFIRTILGLRP